MRTPILTDGLEKHIPIEPPRTIQREFDTVAIPDVHASVEQFGHSLERAGLVQRTVVTKKSGDQEVWDPTDFGAAETTRTVLLGDLPGLKIGVVDIAKRITELRKKGMHIVAVGGNWEVAMYHAALHGSQSREMQEWANIAGEHMPRELELHFGQTKESPYRRLIHLLLEEGNPVGDALGPQSTQAIYRADDTLYSHALPRKKWLDRMGTQLHDGVHGMNDFYHELLSTPTSSKELMNGGEYSSLLWGDGKTPGMLTTEEADILHTRGIRHIVTGHYVHSEPQREMHHGISLVGLDTGIGKNLLAQYAFSHTGRDGSFYVVSGKNFDH